MSLPKITTSVQFVAQQNEPPKTLPKIVFLSSEYDSIYKANEPFYIYSQSDAQLKLNGKLLSKVVNSLDTFSVVDEVTGEIRREAVVVPVELAIPKYLDTVSNPLVTGGDTGEVTVQTGNTYVDGVTSNFDLDFGTNLTILIEHDTTKGLTQTIKLDNESSYTGSVPESSLTGLATGGSIDIPIDGLEGEILTISLLADPTADDWSSIVNVEYYRKPVSIAEKIVALEIALNKLEGYPSEYVIFDEASFGEYLDDDSGLVIDQDDVTMLSTAMAKEGFNISSTVSGDLDITDPVTVKEFYTNNDLAVRVADYCHKNSDQFRRVLAVLSAIRPKFSSYSAIKTHIQKLIALNSNEQIQKIRDTYGEYVVVNNIFDKNLEPMTNMVLRLMYKKSFNDSFYNTYLSDDNAVNVTNIVPYKFADKLDEAGYVFTKYDESFVVIPFIRTMNKTNKQSVRTIKLINNILNETRDIAKKYIGRANSAINRTLLSDEINSNLSKNYTQQNKIQSGRAEVRVGETSGAIGALNVYIIIKDFYEIGDIKIYMTYEKTA